MGECFFWYRLTWVVPDKIQRAVKRLCVVIMFALHLPKNGRLFLPLLDVLSSVSTRIVPNILFVFYSGRILG